MMTEDLLQEISAKLDIILREERDPETAWLRYKESLTPAEVEKLYGYSEATLQNWRYHKVGPRYFKQGRIVLYRQRDLRDFQERGLVKTRDQR